MHHTFAAKAHKKQSPCQSVHLVLSGSDLQMKWQIFSVRSGATVISLWWEMTCLVSIPLLIQHAYTALHTKTDFCPIRPILGKSIVLIMANLFFKHVLCSKLYSPKPYIFQLLTTFNKRSNWLLFFLHFVVNPISVVHLRPQPSALSLGVPFCCSHFLVWIFDLFW